MRVSLILAAIILSGCAGPSEEMPTPQLFPESSFPAPGVEWTNLTGRLDAGSCHVLDARASPPSLLAWWLRGTPGTTLLVANFTNARLGEDLCATRAGDPSWGSPATPPTHGRAEIRSGDGLTFALACDGSTAQCEVRFWRERIQGVARANGTIEWAGEAQEPAGWS